MHRSIACQDLRCSGINSGDSSSIAREIFSDKHELDLYSSCKSLRRIVLASHLASRILLPRREGPTPAHRKGGYQVILQPRPTRFLCLIALAIIACFIASVKSPPAAAQATPSPSFTISGTVTNGNGQGLADVTMVLLSDITGTQIILTDQSG